MTRLVEDARTAATGPVRFAPAWVRGPGPARWWPSVVVAAGAVTGAGLGYRVGARHDRRDRGRR
jgi:hypothetical protein